MRKTLLLIGAVVIAGAAAFLLFGRGGDEPATVAQQTGGAPTLFQWESYMDPPFLAQYERERAEKPSVMIYADEDEAFAKMRAGYQPDVMGPCYYEYPRWQEAGLLQPIDVSKLKNWGKISPSLRNLPGLAAGENRVWFVPHYWGNTSITYRTDLAPEYVGKESWNILFDPKYKGRVAVLEGVDDTVPFIARMIGIDAYNMSAEDWQKVQAKLKELIPQLRFVSSDETTLAQALASGEVVAAMSWRVTYATLKEEGVPVAYMNPPGGIFTYVCGLVVHKNAKDYDKALALVDSSLSDEAANYTVTEIGDGPANTEALNAVPEEVLAELGIPRDVDAFLSSGYFQKRLPNKDEIVNAWAEIRAGL
jgi:spermidine/putrescine transport system substrate-binding protein